MDNNHFSLEGNLGENPRVLIEDVSSDSKPSIKLAVLKLARNYNLKNMETGEEDKKTDWHTIFVKGKTASHTLQNFKKGDRVLISGFMTTKSVMTEEGYREEVPKLIGKRILPIHYKHSTTEEKDIFVSEKSA